MPFVKLKNGFMIVDTHAHLMFPQFRGEVDEVIENAKQSGVEKIINIGCNKKTSEQAVEMLNRYDNLYATLGIHPYDSAEATDNLMERWAEEIAKNEKILAIGECGLDYFKAEVPKGLQKNAFYMQLELAKNCGLPVVIHNRDADEDTLEILNEYEGIDVVFHCYGSNLDFAEKLWIRGYMTSFTGIVTYPNAQEIKEVAREVPMDMFMVETDCPYLAPQAYRGERNQPAYTIEVVREIARLKGISFKEVERASTENAFRFFGKLD